MPTEETLSTAQTPPTTVSLFFLLLSLTPSPLPLTLPPCSLPPSPLHLLSLSPSPPALSCSLPLLSLTPSPLPLTLPPCSLPFTLSQSPRRCLHGHGHTRAA